MAALAETVVIATGNPGKLREMQVLLEGLGVGVVAQSELGVEPPEETGSTFVENALQKARHAAAATGLPAIADDSGLVVPSLDGAPGIYSARYAGPNATDEQNLQKLLSALEGSTEREAYFHCAAVFVQSADDPEPLIAEASWHGAVTAERRGSGGFGYDPVFYDPASGQNAAELTAEQKNARSHRGQAIRALAELLYARFAASR